MLDRVNCKVLSIIKSEHVDAYLLSESSMFVFPHKVILKTCGTTTLLCGVHKMLEIAALEAGFDHVLGDPVRGTATTAIPYRVFYSRKNFQFPDKQHGPHRSWRDEVRFLDKVFLGGSAYMVGKMNGEHWYLYLTEPGTSLTPPSTPQSEDHIHETQTKVLSLPSKMKGVTSSMGVDEAQDETLEILMTDLEPENAKQFYLDHASAVAESQYFDKAHQARKGGVDGLRGLDNNGLGNDYTHDKSLDGFDVFSNTSSDNEELTPEEDEMYPEELTADGHALGTVISESCGLSHVYPLSKYPDARVDAYLFTPCGFSANAVIPAPAFRKDKSPTHYFTVHVTPEPHCSYASFETNVPGDQSGRETGDIVEQVVTIFKPGRFSVTLFEAKGNEYDTELSFSKKVDLGSIKRSARMDHLPGYRRVDRIVHDLDGYDLVFRYYERNDWKGGAPRLGENLF
jgi:S-adenosylmethionine decarboxylase